MTIVGYLENLSYGEKTDRLAKETGLKASALREGQETSLEERFERKGVKYKGPMENLGNFYFKMPENMHLSIRENVLNNLDIDNSLKIMWPIFGKDFEISLGFVVNNYTDDRYSDRMTVMDDNLVDIGRKVSAFKRQRGEFGSRFQEPYFLVANREFDDNFPTDASKDKFLFW